MIAVRSIMLVGGPLDGEEVIGVAAGERLECKARVFLEPDGAAVVGLDQHGDIHPATHVTLHYVLEDEYPMVAWYRFAGRDEGATLCAEGARP